MSPAAGSRDPDQRLHRLHRLLNNDHLRFYRAVMDGVEMRRAWSLYLPLEDEFSDAEARAVLAWTRQSLLVHALNIGASDLVGLLRRDPRGIRLPQVPTLEEFAAAFPAAGDFSEQELLELWQAEHGDDNSRRAHARRDRLSRRLREAIDRLQGALQRQPAAADAVALWLAPALAQRLVDAGLPTLGALRLSLDQRRAKRWPQVPGVGAVWADRLLHWLADHGVEAVAPQALPHALMHPLMHEQDTPSSTAQLTPLPLLPLERLPATVHDDAAPPSPGAASAVVATAPAAPIDDRQLILDWLALHAGNAHTLRLYRRVAERLLLWCRFERRCALPTLKPADGLHYRRWLQSLGRLTAEHWAAAGWHLPAERWIGERRGARRDSADWRPFDGPLSEASVAQDLAVLRALFAHLLANGLAHAQPFGVTNRSRKLSTSRSTAADGRSTPGAGVDTLWAALSAVPSTDAGAGARPFDERAARLKALLWLLGPCGLRPAEALALRLGDLRPVAPYGPTSTAKAEVIRWQLRVPALAGRPREIELDPAAATALHDYLARLGIDPPALLARQPAERQDGGAATLTQPLQQPLLRGQRGRRVAGRELPQQALSYSSLELELRTHARRCAQSCNEAQRELRAELLRFNARRWRELCASAALSGGESLTSVQRRLGHASLASTERLLRPEN